jgi:hypothetical protein
MSRYGRGLRDAEGFAAGHGVRGTRVSVANPYVTTPR